MNEIFDDAFAHHVWATVELIDACSRLAPEQLEKPEPGTYGSILGTMRHLVGADSRYLHALSGQRIPVINDEAMGLSELSAAMQECGRNWTALLASRPDPDQVIVRRRDDGSEVHVVAGILIGQALHHGTDHRSQVCTALTSLGIEPPDIDVWSYGSTVGRVINVPATS